MFGVKTPSQRKLKPFLTVEKKDGSTAVCQIQRRPQGTTTMEVGSTALECEVLPICNWVDANTPQYAVAIPARDEEARIISCLDACLSSMRRYGELGIVVLAVNNTSDQTAAVAQAWAMEAGLPIEIISVEFPDSIAHAGSARRLSMDRARMFLAEDGILLTTDADSQPGIEWISENLKTLRAQRCLVCGRVELSSAEVKCMPPGAFEVGHSESVYKQLSAELTHLIDPDPINPWPHHGQSSGASLAMHASSYDSVGGLPVIACGEDRALAQAFRSIDLPVLFSDGPSVVTSCRLDGRASGGMADTIAHRMVHANFLCDEQLEPADQVVQRAMLRSKVRRAIGDPSALRSALADFDLAAAVFAIGEKIEKFGRLWAFLERESPLLLRKPMLRKEMERDTPRLLLLRDWARKDTAAVRSWPQGAQPALRGEIGERMSLTDETWPGLEASCHTITSRASQIERSGGGLTFEMALLHELGLLIACAPEAFGGSALGQVSEQVGTAFEILRRIGRASLPVARIFEGHLNAAKLISLYGSKDTKEAIFKAVSEGAVLGVWGAEGMTPVTFEERQNGSAELMGEKIFASGLGCVSFAIITARSKAENTTSRLFVVDVSETKRQDASAWTAAGMKSTLSGKFNFDGLTLPKYTALGNPGDYEKEPHFEGGVWRYCAAQIGGAEALIDLTLNSMANRKHIDDPVQLSRISRVVGMCRAASSLVREWALRIESSIEQARDTPAEAMAGALLARDFVAEMCIEVLQQCERCLGTSAHMTNTEVERVRRDLSLYIRQAAPDAKLLKAGRVLFHPNAEARKLW